MPRARSPDSIKAEEMYHAGISLSEIAEKLGVSPGTVRSWKTRQKWDGEAEPKKRSAAKKKNATKAKKKSATQRNKGGAPRGNKNAVGNTGGGPKNNSKAVKHGAYRAVFFNFLSKEDQELLASMDDIETEDHLLKEIQVLTIRERRVLKAIEAQRLAKGKLYISSVVKTDVKRDFEGSAEEKAAQKEVYEEYRMKNNSPPGYRSDVTTKTEATIDLITRLDRELTSIQRQISADLKMLEDIREQRNASRRADELLPLQKEKLDAEIERMDAQTNKILGTNMELEDLTAAEDLVYGSADGSEVTGDAAEAPDPQEQA